MPHDAPVPEPASGRRGNVALAAAALFAVDPLGLGGVRLRSRAGPRRDAWLASLRALLPAATPWRRLPAHATDERLLGGLDLAATLAAGRPVAQRGLLAQAHGGIVVAAMAERMPAAVAARLAAVLDRGEVHAQRDGLDFSSPARLALIALDEGLDADEALPAALLDRLGLHVDLDGPPIVPILPIPPMPPVQPDWSVQDVAAARLLLPRVRCDDALLEACVAAAAAFGVASSRAPWYVLRAACCAAALAGRENVTADDCSLAVQWVLAPRATQAPAQQERDTPAEPAPAPPTPPTPTSEQAPPPPPPSPRPDAEPGTATASDHEQSAPDAAFDERLIDAVRAAIPPGLLAAMQAGPLRDRRRASAGRAGAQTAARQRGRPVGARRGEPHGGARLNLIETLRAAAPWQRVRRAAQAGAAAPAAPSSAAAPAALSSAAAPAALSCAAAPAALRVLVRREDLHVTRYLQRRATTTLFVIDASGSAALQRLAEAKGAVEQLLADCYARRDQVAVLGFRGTTAQILLPPTRSLLRARRSLAGLPGGGGTPLAAGLDAALNLAEAVQRSGATPLLVLLTDGRANIARDGRPGRERAQIDAMQAARSLAGLGCAALLVDTSAQPSPHAQRLALAMHARYLALPRATAEMLSTAMRAQRR